MKKKLHQNSYLLRSYEIKKFKWSLCPINYPFKNFLPDLTNKNTNIQLKFKKKIHFRVGKW